MDSVIQQGRAIMLGTDGLAPSSRSYNAGIADFEGRRLMAYRFEAIGKGWHSIRMAELVGDEVAKDSAIEIPSLRPWENLEDPRLFLHAGGLWIAWTGADYCAKSWTCRQFYGRLEETESGAWRVVSSFCPNFGKNHGRAKEKNWQFFEGEDGKLYAEYGQSPHVVIQLDGARAVKEYRSPGILWTHGKPSGGTPPIPFAPGQLITFFHAFEADGKHARRYNFAAVVFESSPPFRPVFQSVKPLVIASEADPLPDDIWKPLCIFPCGAVRDGEDWVVSSGVNDVGISLHRFTDAELGLVPIMDFNTQAPFVRVQVVRAIYADDEIQKPGTVLDLPSKSAHDLLRRKRVIQVPSGEPFIPSKS